MATVTKPILLNETGVQIVQALNEVCEAIKAGNSPAQLREMDVNFYDYDGTIVYAYTAAQFLVLGAMPAAPKNRRPGFYQHGWNWPYDKAAEYVEAYGKLNIGMTYSKTQEGTDIVFTVDAEHRRTFMITWQQNMPSAVQIDWGDGAVNSSTTVGVCTLTHEYPSHYPETEYEITLNVVIPGADVDIGDAENGINVFSNVPENWSQLIRVDIGNYFTDIPASSFNNLNIFTPVILPLSITTIGADAFYISSIPFLILNYGLETIESNAFIGCSTEKFFIPSSVTTIDDYGCSGLYNVKECIIPSSVESIGAYAFMDNSFLREVVIPPSITVIPESMFLNCGCLQVIDIPAGTTEISTQAFSGCTIIAKAYIRATTPPTVYEDTFSGIPIDVKFYVPYSQDHSVIAAYKAAQVWSEAGDMIYEMPADEDK